MTGFLINLAVTQRALMLVLSLALVGASGWGLQYLVPDTDYKAFFAADDPQLLAFTAVQDTYTRTDSVLFVIEARNGDLFTRAHLDALKTLTEWGWTLPYSVRVDSLTNFQHTIADADSLQVQELVESTAHLDAAQLQQIRAVALNEPHLLNKLVSKDGRVAGVNVIMELPDKQRDALHEAGEAGRALAQKFAQAYPDLKLHLSGIVEYNYASETIIQGEMATLVPAMFGVVLLVLALMLRSLWGTLVTLLVVVFSIVVAMGLMGWLRWPLTSGSASAPTIVLTMAVADCVHILMTYFFWLRQGLPSQDAMRTSLKVNYQPVFLTSLTTAIGFLSMNFSDLPPFQVLGNVVTFGVIAAYLLAIFLLPALILLVPARVLPKAVQDAHLLDPFAQFVVRRRNGLFWGMGLLSLAIIAFIPRNEINDNFLRFIGAGHPTRDATDFISTNLASFYGIEYSLESTHEGGIYAPAFLQEVDAFVGWLEQQPEVAQVTAITEVFKRLNRNMHGDDPAWHLLPDERELAAQYLLLYEMSLPFGLDLNNQISFDRTQTRVLVNFTEQSTRTMLELEQRIAGYLREQHPQLPYHAASTTLLFSHAGMSNAHSMIKGTLLALVLISAVLVVALRSLKLGLISIVPNLIPAGLAFGIWGMAVGEVGISIAISIGMTLGIVVDNTVHFLSKYVRIRREQGLDTVAAVEYAFSNVGVALLATNGVLIAGFLVLAQSDIALNAHMGLFTALTFVMALVVDFLFLPALLMKLDRGQPPAPAAPLSVPPAAATPTASAPPAVESH